MNQRVQEELKDMDLKQLQEVKKEVDRLIFLNKSMKFGKEKLNRLYERVILKESSEEKMMYCSNCDERQLHKKTKRKSQYNWKCDVCGHYNSE